jgi:hypothetical protein
LDRWAFQLAGVNEALLFGGKKILLKPRIGLINIIWTLHFAKLKRGKMCIEGDVRSGRPKEAVSDENIKEVHKIFLNDHKVKLIEIAETLKISKKRIEHIVHEYLDLQKLCAKWEPRVLTIDQINNVLMIRSNV